MHAGDYFPVVPAARFGNMDRLTFVPRKMDGLTLLLRLDDAVPLFASQQQAASSSSDNISSPTSSYVSVLTSFHMAL
jgi:hypothetical protein